MADDPFEQDDLWDDENEAPELPEPDLTPPDVGGLEPVVEQQQALPPPGLLPSNDLQQELPQPDMSMPLPGQENAPFQVDSPDEQQGAQDGGGMQELVVIGERLAEAVDNINDKMDDLIEKLEGVGTFGP